uniref:Integrase catalytic domain-containing protein n=1 Tax=Vitis vinifera TaxID=29760 RepID=A5B5J7_VITVI|nr:hypothetical protein VITISV_028114 [Vitis vinifera]
MEEEAKPIHQPQRRLNPHMQEVVQTEVLKLFQPGIIYPISNSPWVSPTQVVPKKSRINMVQNDKGEEVSTRLTSGWRVCIDYKKLNTVTRKDHFPLPFMDQVLERVSGHHFYCFLYGYSGYFQIEIVVEDQEKTTFTCPFRTDMVERIMEVFMDDITIYGNTFEECLVNLEAILNRCIEKNLVLNWDKCHFMVHQGIVLGHIISKKGIEVDKAKVELIVKLPSPTTVKGVRQFLGHAGFYRRFIKDFSKLAKPLCELLVKDAKFIWDDRRQWSFEELNDFAIGAILGKREDGKLYVIYYEKESLMLMEISPWYAHIANYLVTGEVPSEWKAQDKKHFFAKIHKTTMKVLQSGFYQPSLFKDAHTKCRSCGKCQRLGKLTRRNMMPLNPILIIDLFDVRGLDFMGPFPMSFGYSYILVGVDYVSKWVKAIPCKHNDHRVVLKFLKENIFSRFGVPKAIISDGGTHFFNKSFETLLAKYGVKHKVATPYHPQTSGQVELANQDIKNILMKMVNTSRRDWSVKIHDSLWAYRIAYKTILGMSPYSLVYGKACHLPLEMEYKAWWAIKKLNMDLNRADMKWFLDLNEMDELRNEAYNNSNIAK